MYYIKWESCRRPLSWMVGFLDLLHRWCSLVFHHTYIHTYSLSIWRLKKSGRDIPLFPIIKFDRSTCVVSVVTFRNYIFIPRFSRSLFSNPQSPRRSGSPQKYFIAPHKKSHYFQGVSFLWRKIVMGTAFLLQFLATHAVWLDDPLDLEFWYFYLRPRVKYFYSWDDPANLRKS